MKSLYETLGLWPTAANVACYLIAPEGRINSHIADMGAVSSIFRGLKKRGFFVKNAP